MKQFYDHIDPINSEKPDRGDIFRRLEVPVSRTREEVWEYLENRIDEPSSPKLLRFRPRWIIAAAASLILLAGVASVLFYTSRTIVSAPGQHLSHILPDGSRVELNADSKISYKPYRWMFSRIIELSGEGFFEVEPGRTFSVVSAQGTTTVLGTTFNIYARADEYKVNCLTGKVKVVSTTESFVVLSPSQSAVIENDGKILVSRQSNEANPVGWLDNMFDFKAVPFTRVMEEIGRQYGVSIQADIPEGIIYTGHFSKNRPLEETLGVVCKPFGFTFARIAENEYIISQN